MSNFSESVLGIIIIIIIIIDDDDNTNYSDGGRVS